MIISYPDVERFSFILDMNDGTPFRGGRYTSTADDRWFPYKLMRVEGPLPIDLQPIEEWLRERTSAFRINTATMVHSNSFEALEPGFGEPMTITAIVIEMPENIAPLFRMFWYER